MTEADQPAGRDATNPGRHRVVQRVATLWAAAAVLTFVAVLLVDRYVQHHGWAFTLALLWALTAPTAALLGRVAARWERRHPPTGTRRPHP